MSRFTTVRLLDGSTMVVEFGGYKSIRSEVRSVRLDLTWCAGDTAWGQSSRRLILHILATMSISSAALYVGAMAALVALRDSHDRDQPVRPEELYRFAETDPYRWRHVRTALRKARRIGATLATHEAMEFADSPDRVEASERDWYLALVTNDPRRGALTDQELFSVLSAVEVAFANGNISILAYAIIMFLAGTGVRPIQMARMRVNDVEFRSDSELVEATLNIPLAKGHRETRRVTWARRANPDLAHVLREYVRVRHGDHPSDASLFVLQAGEINVQIKIALSKIETWSDRLRSPIPLSPYRFRYTLATRAIVDGASDEEVARLLMHRSTYAVQFYRASLPSMQKPIADAVGESLDGIAAQFLGRIVTGASAPSRSDAGAAIMDYERLAGERLGSCGTLAKCSLEAPLACLVCPFFEAFLDAPWEELADRLEADGREERDERIAGIFLPHLRSIAAIMATRDG